MLYVNVWFNFFFSNSLSLQAFNNDGQEVVSTKERPELEDRGITGMYSQLFVSHGQDSWYWIFSKKIVFGDNAVHNSNVTWQGDGRKAASHLEGSGLTFSPVLKRLFEQWSLSFMVKCPTQIAQVPRMKISVDANGSRIQQVRYLLSFRDCLWPWKYETNGILILTT